MGYGSTELGLGATGLIDELGDAPGTPAHLWKGFDKQEIRDTVRAMAGEHAILDGSKPVPEGFMGRTAGVYEPTVVDRGRPTRAGRYAGKAHHAAGPPRHPVPGVPEQA